MGKILKPYIIGETAYNHEGDLQYLYRMIDEIVELDLNGVKFHLLLNPNSYFQKSHKLINEIKKWIFSKNQWNDILDSTAEKNIDVIALCDDVESINYILNESKIVKAIELHATGINDYYLLDALSEWKGQIYLGVGGSTIDEIQYALEFLSSRGKNDIILMYGFQSYPTKYTDINLSKMLKIRDLFKLPVGYADHTAFDDPNNELISIMAALMGFNILEKHYTPDPGKKRIDYHAAVGKEQMERIVKLMELALTVFGDGELTMSEAELEYGNVGPMKKAVVAKKIIKKGDMLSLDNLWFKRTIEQSTVKQNQFFQLIGLKATKNIEEDEIIDFTKVKYEFQNKSLSDLTGIGRR